MTPPDDTTPPPPPSDTLPPDVANDSEHLGFGVPEALVRKGKAQEQFTTAIQRLNDALRDAEALGMAFARALDVQR